jgi:hypothetical protein
MSQSTTPKEVGLYIRLVAEVGTTGGCTSSYDYFVLPMKLQSSRRECPEVWIFWFVFVFFLQIAYVEVRRVFSKETERLCLTIGETSQRHTHKCFKGPEDFAQSKRATAIGTVIKSYVSTKAHVQPKVVKGDPICKLVFGSGRPPLMLRTPCLTNARVAAVLTTPWSSCCS